MNRQQAQVQKFHEAMNLTVGDHKDPMMVDLALRVRLLKEEFKELMDAIEGEYIIDAIDALCDLKYVIDGTAVAWGIDLEPFFDEVHRTNMEKVGGEIRADGKILKPEGWQPPRIAEILEAQLS